MNAAFRRALFPIAVAIALTACGNKGPLVLPSPPAPVDPAPAEAVPDAPSNPLAPAPTDASTVGEGDEVLRVDDATTDEADEATEAGTDAPPPPGNG